MLTACRNDRGKSAALLACDLCGHSTVIPCQHQRARGRDAEVNVGNANRRATTMGWEIRGSEHHCPTCVEQRRSEPAPIKDAAVNEVPNNLPKINNELRQPTKEQKRQILEMLQDTYDMGAQRYRGVETDRSIAEVLGKEFLWGWVSSIREEFFGPGGNEEADIRLSELQACLQSIDALLPKLKKQQMEIDEAVAGLIQKKNELLKAAEVLLAPKRKSAG
jgi:hypothetical protein